MKEKISKLVNVYKKYGFIGFCKKLKAYIIANYLDKVSLKVIFNKKKYRSIIQNILKENNYDRIILWRSSFGYNVELFQRPQHIANNLSKEKCLVFYEVTTMTDKIKELKQQSNNLYLFNFNNIALNKILMKELIKINKPKYVQLYSTDWKLSVENIENYLNNGFGFIYEYIDHLSPELAGTKNIPQNIIDKYEYVMNHKNVYVIVTADLLRDDVINHRGNINLGYSSNGVDYNFFQTIDKNYKLDKDFNNIIKKGKPILMYYGALAKWFDYDLIKEIAKTNKYSIVLFGIKYDEAYDNNIHDEENIYFLGSRDYKVLKNYAYHADILSIPFQINDITRSTSPVKLYEYMALNKPIITTNMNECTKYKSVLIGKNHKDFIAKLDEALKLKKDKNYISLENKEAKENDWSIKAKVIIDLIKKDENN
jgi:teichuronic acid biosynthesis glycosyltransferase TuaH